jgi:CelD/BcsL family acetyltransferase involved in cellulose biosynthesis
VSEDLPAGTPWPTTLPTRILRRTPSPTLAIEGRTWDEFLASRSRNFREQVRRRERKLARERQLRFRLSEDPEQLDADLGALFSLHRARWGDRVEGEFAGRDERFHRDFAHVALERGWLRLWTMELDGRPVAVWYGFRFADVEWYYQAGRDPAWEHASVGFVLLSHSIRSAFEDGVREYRFLRGGEAYKDRFADGGHEVETVAIARGPLGRGAMLAARGARRLPSRLRARVAR